jgi:hypothetical protein
VCLEIDESTQHLAPIREKLRAYRRTIGGRQGWHVLFVVPTVARRRWLRRVAQGLELDGVALWVVTVDELRYKGADARLLPIVGAATSRPMRRRLGRCSMWSMTRGHDLPPPRLAPGAGVSSWDRVVGRRPPRASAEHEEISGLTSSAKAARELRVGLRCGAGRPPSEAGQYDERARGELKGQLRERQETTASVRGSRCRGRSE